MKIRIYAFVLLALSFAEANAGCYDQDSMRKEPAGRSCLATELREADVELNRVYADLAAIYDKSHVELLREAQRAWLASRDSKCHLAKNAKDKESWLNAILDDRHKTACVLRMTRGRTSTLAKWLLAAQEGKPGGTPPADSLDTRSYQWSSTRVHDRGRWYFEIEVDAARIAALGSNVLSWGIVSERIYHGKMMNLRKDVRYAEGITHIGVAVDLENGEYHTAYDGRWERGPDGAGGADIPLGRNYAAYLETTEPLGPLLQAGLVRVNSGDRPFAFPMPAGYRAFDDNVAVPAPAWVYPPSTEVAGISIETWLQRFFSRTLSQPASASFRNDGTGELCSVNQVFPVWFLAGGGGQEQVVRKCTIPANKPVLVPVNTVMVFAKTDNDCNQIVEAVRSASLEVRNIWLRLDGALLPAVETYRTYTKSCVPINQLDGTSVGTRAAFGGYTVVLTPLSPGKHVVEFGAVNTSEMGPSVNNVRYELEVR